MDVLILKIVVDEPNIDNPTMCFIHFYKNKKNIYII